MAAPNYGVSDHYLGVKGENYFAWQSAGGEFAAQITAHDFRPHVRPSDTVLDFGCGGGFLLGSLDCARRIGVEVNPVARAHAQQLGVECHATIDDIPFSVADVVISNHALEHVPFPIGALRTLRERLKPGGRLLLGLPIDNWQTQKRYDPADQNHHLHTWTAQLLGNTLVEAGFRRFEIRYRINAWPPRWTVFCYGRFPLWMFRTVCHTYGWLTGKGRELLAVAWRDEINP